MKEFYAHSVDGKPVDEWHLLDAHLKGTAERAAAFAAEFGCSEWGRLAGLWHDMGVCRKKALYISTTKEIIIT
mgnify:CR=1 FL=1|jgi:CRISPR-associated endonuclease/helicase Cas3